MKVEKIVTLKKDNINQIILLKEGIFWRVYNFSAFLFTEYIQEFKITKKYVKTVNIDIVYLGFPSSILERILKKAADNFRIILETDIRRAA